MRLFWPFTVKVKGSHTTDHQAISNTTEKAKTPKIVENKKIRYKTCKTCNKYSSVVM